MIWLPGVLSQGGVKGRPVKCIRSTGTQYINSDFIPNQDTRIVCDYKGIAPIENSVGSLGGGLFGSRHSRVMQTFSFFHYNVSADGSTDGYNANVIERIPLSTGRTVLDKNKNVTTVNGKTYTHTYAAFACGWPMFIFAINQQGTVQNQVGSFEIYSFKIYDNDALVRDYIPWVDSQEVACFYDLVCGERVYNSGSGYFEYTEFATTGTVTLASGGLYYEDVVIEFEIGMTWGEWVLSEYNTISAQLYGVYILNNEGDLTLYTHSTIVLKDDIISSTMSYDFTS